MTIKDRFIQGWLVARKELRSFFETPIAYIVAVLFISISEFLFFLQAFLVGEASLSLFVNFLPWLWMFVVPALTMGAFATERETGTYETLVSRPLSEWEIVGGKFVAVLLYLMGLLALAFIPIAVSFSFFGPLDWGVAFSAYLASVFLSAVFAAVGLAVSSFFTKQVSALLVSIAVSFFLVVVGLDLVAQAAPLVFARLLDRISVLSHFQSMARGVVDIRDLWYYLSVVVAFLAIAEYRLLSNRFARTHTTRTRFRVGMLIVVLIALISNVLGSAIPGRLDLTADGLYTMSPATKHILADLPDVVNITLYASSRLPSQLQPVLRDTRDLLRDYERYGNGNIVLTIKDPDTAPEVANEASASGVQPIQFNTVGQGELSVKKGYLGIAITHAGDTRSVPFVENTGDLEYQLTSAIAELTTTNKKHVVMLTGHGEHATTNSWGTFEKELGKLYTVDQLSISSTTDVVASGTSVIIIGDPTTPLSDHEQQVIKAYIDNGGATFLLTSGVQVNVQYLYAAANAGNLGELVSTYGLTGNKDLVYDLRSNQVVQLSGGNNQVYLLPYPFWMRVAAVPGSPVTAKLQSVFVPWGSSLSVDGDVAASAHATVTPLLVTSPYAGLMSDSFSIDPNQQLPQDDLGQHIIAAAITGVDGNNIRVVVAGTGSLLDDQMVSQTPENLAFGLNAVAWLAQDESLASIKVKSGARRQLTFGSAAEQAFVEYGTITFGVLIPLLIGFIIFMRRRALKQYTYSSRPV